MSLQRAPEARRKLAALAFSVGLFLTVVSCGGSGDDDSPSEQKGSASQAPSNSADGQGDTRPSEDPGAEASTQSVIAESKNGDLSLSITSAVRDRSGYVTVEGAVTNGGARLWTAADWKSDEQELSKNASSLAGASLIDQTGKKRYLILRDTQGKCLCTQFVGGVRAGQTSDWYAQFPAPPQKTTSVTFQIGSMPPAEIPLTEAQ